MDWIPASLPRLDSENSSCRALIPTVLLRDENTPNEDVQRLMNMLNLSAFFADWSELTPADILWVQTVIAEVFFHRKQRLTACFGGSYKNIRENILHVAMTEGMTQHNFDVIVRLLPKVENKKHLMCVLCAAAYELSESQFLLLLREVYDTTDNVFSLCLIDAIGFPSSKLIQNLQAVWNFSAVDIISALTAAICCGDWDLVEELVTKYNVGETLMKSCLIKAFEARQQQSLEAGVIRADDQVVRCESNIDMNVGTKHPGGTFLWEVITQEKSLRLLELLLKAGLSPDVEDKRWYTSLHIAAQMSLWDSLSLLIAFSRNLGEIASKIMPSGKTILHVLCKEGQIDLLQTLLLKNANPLVRDRKGRTLMMTALRAKKNNESLCRVLISSGVSTHQVVASKLLLEQYKNKWREINLWHFPSPLCQAACHGQLRIAKLLYASGACSNSEVYETSSCFSLRGYKERPDILSYLDEISSRPRSLRDLCALEVSHLIGCQAGRDVRIARTGLPKSLCTLAMHDHVTNLDFLQDTPYDPERSRYMYRHRCCQQRNIWWPFYKHRGSPSNRIYWAWHRTKRLFLCYCSRTLRNVNCICFPAVFD